MPELVAPWLQGGGGASQAPNPLGLMGEVMKLRQGQAEWTARQNFGNIMAGSGSLEEALAAAQKDPSVSAFAPQLLTELRNQQKLQYDVQGMQLGQAKDGRSALAQALTASGNDPDKFMPALQGAFSALPGNVQKNVMPYGQTIANTLLDGLPTEPGARSAEFAKRKAQLMISSGMKPEEAYASIGGVWMPPGIHDVTGPGGAVSPTPYGGPMGLPGAGPGAGAGGAGAGGAGGVGPGAGLQIGAPLGTGPTTIQKNIQEGAGTYAKRMTEESADVLQKNAPALMQTMDTVVDAMKYFQTGGGAGTQIWAAKDLQALERFGMPLVKDLMKDMKDAGGTLSKAQVIQSLTRYYSTQLFKEAATGAGFGRLNIEAQQFAQMLNETTDPAAIVALMNQTKKNVQRSVDQFANWPAYRNSVSDERLGDYPQWWSANRAGKEVESYGGMNFKPYDPKDVLGGTASKFEEGKTYDDGKNLAVRDSKAPGGWRIIGPSPKAGP